MRYGDFYFEDKGGLKCLMMKPLKSKWDVGCRFEVRRDKWYLYLCMKMHYYKLNWVNEVKGFGLNLNVCCCTSHFSFSNCVLSTSTRLHIKSCILFLLWVTSCQTSGEPLLWIHLNLSFLTFPPFLSVSSHSHITNADIVLCWRSLLDASYGTTHTLHAALQHMTGEHAHRQQARHSTWGMQNVHRYSSLFALKAWF